MDNNTFLRRLKFDNNYIIINVCPPALLTDYNVIKYSNNKSLMIIVI